MLILMALVGCSSDLTEIGDYGFEADDKEFSEPHRPHRLIVEQDAAAPNEDIVLSGSTDVHVGSFRMRTTGEPMLLTDFTLANGGYDQTIDYVTVRYGDGDGMTESLGVLSGGEVVFSGEDMLIPASRTGAVLEVYATMNTSFDASPGMELRLDWVDDRVEAIGLRSGRTYREPQVTDGVEGVEFEWHVSKPTVTLSSGSPPSGPGIPGLAEWLRFNIAAAEQGNIGITSIMFELASSDNAGSSWNRNISGCDETSGLEESDFSLYNLSTDGTSTSVETDNGEWLIYWSSWSNCEEVYPVQYVMLDLDHPIEIPAGNTHVFALYMDATGADTDDSLRLDIVGMRWEDAGYPFDEYLVDDLPVTGNTIVF
jgi:hypothetical protein